MTISSLWPRWRSQWFIGKKELGSESTSRQEVLLEAISNKHFNLSLAPKTQASSLSAFRHYLPRYEDFLWGLSSPLNPEKLWLVGDHPFFFLSEYDGAIMAFPPTQFELCSAAAESGQREMAASLDVQNHDTCPPSSHSSVIYHLFSLKSKSSISFTTVSTCLWVWVSTFEKNKSMNGFIPAVTAFIVKYK